MRLALVSSRPRRAGARRPARCAARLRAVGAAAAHPLGRRDGPPPLGERVVPQGARRDPDRQPRHRKREEPSAGSKRSSCPPPSGSRVREAFWARTGFPVDPDAAVEQLKARLSDAFDRFLEGVAANQQVAFDDDGWRLKTDAAEQPDPAQSDSLAELQRLGRAPTLAGRPQPLEPARRPPSSRSRTTSGSASTSSSPARSGSTPGEVCALLAANPRHGCNLGLYTMEKVAPDIAYRRLKYVSDWRLVDENQRAALAAIVHGISRLDAAGHWGDGTTSTSDGQRFAMPQRVLQRTYSTRFNDFAIRVLLLRRRQLRPVLQPPDRVHRPRRALRARRRAVPRERPRPRRALHRHPRVHRDAAFGMVGMRFCPRIRSLRAARPAQGRAAPRPGAGRLLRAAGAHQRPRGLRPGERVLVPDPDPRLHRLLAGPGRSHGWPRRQIRNYRHTPRGPSQICRAPAPEVRLDSTRASALQTPCVLFSLAGGPEGMCIPPRGRCEAYPTSRLLSPSAPHPTPCPPNGHRRVYGADPARWPQHSRQARGASASRPSPDPRRTDGLVATGAPGLDHPSVSTGEHLVADITS